MKWTEPTATCPTSRLTIASPSFLTFAMTTPSMTHHLAPRFLVNATCAKEFLSDHPTHTTIVNAPLVDLDRGCHACNQLTLHRDVEKSRDFIVVNSKKWTTLCTEGGVDYESRRFLRPPQPTHGHGDVKSQKKLPMAITSPQQCTLDLYPPEMELLYWDQAQAAAIECRHCACGHPLRILHQLRESKTASVSATTGDIVRKAILDNAILDEATLAWVRKTTRRAAITIRSTMKALGKRRRMAEETKDEDEETSPNQSGSDAPESVSSSDSVGMVRMTVDDGAGESGESGYTARDRRDPISGSGRLSSVDDGEDSGGTFAS